MEELRADRYRLLRPLFRKRNRIGDHSRSVILPAAAFAVGQRLADLAADDEDVLVTAVRRATTQGALPGADPVHTSVLVWCLAHGMVSLELTHATRGPQPGWFPDSAEAGERILLDGVRATLLGRREPT